jgi:hypothetical protein
MPTPYSSSNQAFSDAAHQAAQSLIYPCVFKTGQPNLAFESTSLSTSPKNAILDGEMATDRIVKVTVKTLCHPLQFTVQERFRKPQYASFQDITITEWNCATNLPSELYKLNSGMFVYGYFDQNTNVFVDWVAFNTVGLLYQFATAGAVFRIQSNPRSNQDFYTVSFAFLQSTGLIIARK